MPGFVIIPYNNLEALDVSFVHSLPVVLVQRKYILASTDKIINKDANPRSYIEWLRRSMKKRGWVYLVPGLGFMLIPG